MSHAFIMVQITGKSISVNPTRLFVERGTGAHDVVWTPGVGVDIESIRFKNGGAPIDPVKQADGTWRGSFDTSAEAKSWHYEITVAGHNPLDPEIENGPGTT